MDVVDEVLSQLERDEHMRFTLDGQLATLDDYLEIRPEAEARIRALVSSGRLALGPWQTLMDEFLVDGETTLRNLEAGLARASDFGSAMRVGYLPDMFGHVAQMPQILRRDIYATAAIVGIILYLLLQTFGLPRSGAFGTGMAAIVALRLLAIRWGLRLPIFRVQ